MTDRDPEYELAYQEAYRDALIGVVTMLRRHGASTDTVEAVLRCRPDGTLCAPSDAVKLPENA